MRRTVLCKTLLETRTAKRSHGPAVAKVPFSSNLLPNDESEMQHQYCYDVQGPYRDIHCTH